MNHYEKTIAIGQRLDATLQLVAAGRYSTPQIADELGVSTATVSRCVEALRKQGHDIQSVKHGSRWSYVLQRSSGKRVALEKAGKP